MLLPLVATACVLGAHGWDYHGAASWGGQCSVVGQQSPIDLATSAAYKEFSGGGLDGSIAFSEEDNLVHPVKLHTNLHTWEVVYGAAGAVQRPTVSWGSKIWTLEQLQFHSPSEHTLDGKYAAMEMHMVHKAPDTKALVVAVMLDMKADADAHPFLAKFWPPAATTFPKTVVDGAAPVATTLTGNPYAQMVPSLGHADGFMQYNGSFTTPPCTENTVWLVMLHRPTISKAQFDAYRAGITAVPGNQLATQYTAPTADTMPGMQVTWNSAQGVNNRPIQTTGTRTIFYYEPGFLERIGAWQKRHPYLFLLIVLLVVLLLALCIAVIVYMLCCRGGSKPKKTRAVKVAPKKPPAPAVMMYQPVQQQVQMMQVPTYAAAPMYQQQQPLLR